MTLSKLEGNFCYIESLFPLYKSMHTFLVNYCIQCNASKLKVVSVTLCHCFFNTSQCILFLSIIVSNATHFFIGHLRKLFNNKIFNINFYLDNINLYVNNIGS